MTRYIIANANVITMDDARPTASAFAVADGRIEALGTPGELRSAHPDYETVDLQGRTVLPGFIDTHTHVEMTALTRHFWVDVREESRTAILDRIGERVRCLPAGSWIVAQGTFGQILPSKEELDEIAPDHPVAVRWSMHKFVVNQSALDAAGLTAVSTPPPGARFQHNADGTLNGVLEECWDLLPVPPNDDEALERALEETLSSYFLANGVTTVHEIGFSRNGVQILRALSETGRAPRIGLSLTVAPGHQPLATLTDESVSPFAQRLGTGRFWYQGYKIFMDGGRDGAFRRSGTQQRADAWGLLTRLYPTLIRELTTASDAKIQVYVHAIGDLSQEIAVSAVERVHEKFPHLDHRIRIEHLFNESQGTELLDRLNAAGGIAAPNPGFVFAEPDSPGDRQPPEASKYALRTLADHQGMIPGNSDTAGAQPFTTNPWFTMRCMVELKNKHGVAVNPAETVDLHTALRAFTVDAAYSTFSESERGSLEVGKSADFAVIAENPFDVPVEELDSIRTMATVIGGTTVYGRL